MKIKIAILLMGSMLVLLSFAGYQRRPERPNIILIFMDDMGYGDLGVTGALNYQTPNLDKLAHEGIRFTNFLAAQPICTASRAGLLTGCYPNRIGLVGALFPNSAIGINPDETTLPEMLKSVGYQTAMIGKWHLGDKPQFMPLQHGFDHFYGLPYSNDIWPLNYDGSKVQASETAKKLTDIPLPLYEGYQVKELIQDLGRQDNLTTEYTQKAVQFIENAGNRPFFLYLAHTMPHVPLAVSAKFKGKSGKGLYADVMMEIDWSVGEIMNALSRKKLDQNTLIIFTSDNGPWVKFGDNAGSSGGFREGKQTPFEGGLRVPMLVRWKGAIPGGVVCNQLASTIDLLPTISSITGAPLPKNKIDGVNMLGLLKGQLNQSPRRYFYYYFGKNDLRAVRRDNWKLILPFKNDMTNEGILVGKNRFPGITAKTDRGMELFDLAHDPNERYDVQKNYPEIVDELLQVAENARADLGDDLTKRVGRDVRPAGRVD